MVTFTSFFGKYAALFSRNSGLAISSVSSVLLMRPENKKDQEATTNDASSFVLDYLTAVDLPFNLLPILAGSGQH